MTDLTPPIPNGARLLPVLTIHDPNHAVPIARALVAGGVRTLEITLRARAAQSSIEAIIAEVPEAVVGVGTVLTPTDYNLARRLGAKFALSPGATPALLGAAAAGDLPFVPGIASASELMAAMERGFSTVKLFPASLLGGVAAIRALGAPFPAARFCPTGGITERDASNYLALPNVVAIGGSWLVTEADARDGDWQAITLRARSAMAALGSRTL